MKAYAHTPRRPRIRRDAHQWRELMAEHDRSGLSVSAFCLAHGLAKSSFCNWRRRLKPALLPSAPRFLPIPLAATGPGASRIEISVAGMTVRAEGEAAHSILDALVRKIGA